MTRYEELSALAVQNIQKLYDDKAERESDAHFVVRELIKYLQAPEGTVQFAELDKAQAATGKTGNLALIYCADGAWHFGVQLHFKSVDSPAYSKVTLKMSLRSRPPHAVLTFEREFLINRSDPESASAFLSFVFTGLAEDYAKPVGVPKERIGF